MTDLDLDALDLDAHEHPWPLADVCPPPLRPLWQVTDRPTGLMVAFGRDREDAIDNAQRRLSELADRRGIAIPQLLGELREVRHAR